MLQRKSEFIVGAILIILLILSIFIFYIDNVDCPRLIKKGGKLSCNKYFSFLADSLQKYNDIYNLKYNNSFRLDFINVGSELQQLINNTKSLTNRYPFSGLAIVTNRYGIVSYTKYLNSNGIGLNAELHKLVQHILHE